MKNPGVLIGGLILGTGLGVAAGLLLAPRSGKQTRKKISKGSVRLKKEMINYVEGSLDDLRKQFNHKIDQIAGKGKQAINHTSEKVKLSS